MSGGALYLDSLDCFQLRGSSVDGTATLLVEEGGMLWMLNTNVVSEFGRRHIRTHLRPERSSEQLL